MEARIKRLALPALALLLALAAALCLWGMHAAAHALDSQYAAVRWQGDSDMPFAQLSCYMPRGEKLGMKELYTLKSALYQKLKDASLDPEAAGLYNDAWSAGGTVRVSGSRRSGEVQAVAVGGRFFDFHPLRLVSGSYLSPDDLMDDRVLLDEETAWMLFGASDLAGMSLSVNGVPFVVAGVYAHPDDRFSRRAGEGEMCVYLSYDAFLRLYPEQEGVDCYELVMADPVRGFARASVQEKFPVKNAGIVENSARFTTEALLRLLKNRSTRSMQLSAAAYPRWENAARAAEDSAARWLELAIVCALLPCALLLYWAVRLMRRGKTELSETLLPRVRADAEERLRRIGRRRWERKHPDGRG